MSKVFKRLLSCVGKVKISDLSEEWRGPVVNALDANEKANPLITKAEIMYYSPRKSSLIVLTFGRRGSKPHQSSTDPDDPEHVISIKLLKESGSRVCSIHVHQDGTFKQK
ncbi:hypothetical protein MMC07_000641 [Pseudocyphellaria aurata]|nr:hypothetical protein [Pseudocyphellaria aurata]